MRVVQIEYENWRGEVRYRRILPHPETLRFGTSEWHKEPQWLFKATCLEDQTVKEFAMGGVSDWIEADDQRLPWRGAPGYVETPRGETGVRALVEDIVKAVPLDFPNFGKGDTHNVEIVRGGTYYVTAEQARVYEKEFRRLGIKTIPIEEKQK